MKKKKIKNVKKGTESLILRERSHVIGEREKKGRNRLREIT